MVRLRCVILGVGIVGGVVSVCRLLVMVFRGW